MFTLDQIHQAHGKVKSGADFPAYIRELKGLGVLRYQTFVRDGHTDFFGEQGYRLSTQAKYAGLTISETSDPDQFQLDLRAHQQGLTDYPGFCADCARSGIEKWEVDLGEMSCCYFDKAGGRVLTEEIPQ